MNEKDTKSYRENEKIERMAEAEESALWLANLAIYAAFK